MKTWFSSRSSTMAMAIVLVLGLLGTLASACEDDPTYYFKKPSQTCEWISTRNDNKKRKLCRKNKIKKKCPVTCNACDDLFKKKCPKTQRKMDKLYRKEQCDDYVSGLNCPYNHVYTGCSAGIIQCSPQQIYTCFDNDPPPGKSWALATVRLEYCPDAPYGEPCDPDECPPIEPEQGASCAWYGDGDTCGYNPIWFGCGFDDLECDYLFHYTCDPVTLTWDKYIRPQKRCATPPGSPKGQTCEIGEEPPPPPPETCDVEPTAGTKCNSGSDVSCLGGYSVTGCSSDVLQCSPSYRFDCNERGFWEQYFFPVVFCISLDPRFGQPCEPGEPIPPPPPPPPTGPCDPEPEIPSNCELGVDRRCFGGYSIRGCTSDTLECVPGVAYNCDIAGFGGGIWSKEFLPQTECISDDPRWGKPCDPNQPLPPPPPPQPCRFEPEAGQSCKPDVDGTCLGGFTYFGCSPTNFGCRPGISYTCTPEGVWDSTFLRVPLCDSDDALFGEACDLFACPLIEPTEGGDCFVDSEEICYYNYRVLGCSSNTLACSPQTSFKCEKNQWKEEGLVYPACAANDSRWGLSCDPGEELPPAKCPPFKPFPGDACPPVDRLCYYDYELLGCSSNTLQCTATTAFECGNEGKDDVWVPSPIFLPTCVASDPLWGTECEP